MCSICNIEAINAIVQTWDQWSTECHDSDAAAKGALFPSYHDACICMTLEIRIKLQVEFPHPPKDMCVVNYILFVDQNKLNLT